MKTYKEFIDEARKPKEKQELSRDEMAAIVAWGKKNKAVKTQRKTDRGGEYEKIIWPNKEIDVIKYENEKGMPFYELRSRWTVDDYNEGDTVTTNPYDPDKTKPAKYISMWLDKVFKKMK